MLPRAFPATLIGVCNFVRGRTWLTRPFWWLFRWLFPAYIHDVLWNHSLCQLKDLLEANPEPGQLGVLRSAPK